jgi:hypothetical protein
MEGSGRKEVERKEWSGRNGVGGRRHGMEERKGRKGKWMNEKKER